MRNFLAVFAVSTVLAGPALAQDMLPPAPAPASADSDDRIIVTGSRIKRLIADSPVPISVFTQEDLRTQGISSPEQFVAFLTSNGNGLDNLASNADVVSGQARGNNGASSANLRNQGAAATLILLNGRRVPAHGLNGGVVDINQIPLVGGRGPARQDQRLRLFPQFSGVTVYSPPWGDSSYHALNTKIEKRFSGGLGFTANLTWAKFLDNAVSGSELGGSAGSGYTHYELRGLDKSYSGNDVRLRWVSSAVYELPFGRGRAVTLKNPLLNGIAGGWGLGVIAELRTGAPYGAIEQTNRGNAFSGSPRPNLLWDPAIHGKRSRGEMLAHYFDTGAFEMPAAGVFGNAARNVGFGPGFAGMDVSAHKVWPLLSERINLRFRSDVYNLPNRPNFANPARLRGRADFGQISGVLTGTGGRVFQLSLRLEF